MRRRRPKTGAPWLAPVILVAALGGCHGVLDPALHEPPEVPEAPSRLPVLKVHMTSGELWVLHSWTVAEDGSRLDGTGTRYSIAREPMEEGPASLEVAEVALFETNRPDKVAPLGTTLLGIMTTVAGAVTLYCASDPKACFGSCPTFYVHGGSPDRPAAEGFSSSFARALESLDVDALPRTRASGHRLTVTMRNEALETHAVRRVRLLVAPRPPGGHVLAGVDGRFYPGGELQGPRRCRAAEGDCLTAVTTRDGEERWSAADRDDLATREVVEVEFGPVEGRVGLVLAARQTLLSTHLFYQSLAYFGLRAGEYLAALERGGPAMAARATGMARALGGLEAQVAEGDGEWRAIGAFDEAGPIASDVQVLPFEATGDGPLRVRLRQARGHWRLDHVALTRLGEPVRPRPVEATTVERDRGPDHRARGLLGSDRGHLITLPGDVYHLVFDLPAPASELELFLESEGYYYEWMREDWLAEEDPEMASLVLSDPAEALRRMAGPFKRHEPEMEQAFWASRYHR